MGAGAKGVNKGIAITISRITEAVTGTMIEAVIGMMIDIIAMSAIIHVNESATTNEIIRVNGGATTHVIIIIPVHHPTESMPAK